MAFPSPESAEAAFYGAFAAADTEAMMHVWADLPDILCVHPLGGVLVGAPAIRASWDELFADPFRRNFVVELAASHHGAEFASRTVYESILIPASGQRFSPMLATNVYRLVDGGWRMVVHHASPAGEPLATLRGPGPATRH
ncbi:MAG: nuclear transport factor 2 family protein [Gammaproteobacteria bacterium]|nr:nuclear transport factor 2 family protein [Gammaproteobacteria bacterium]MBI5616969.1 nuclear transport factor 2 family protein [Gammaproteobacteria bacterium]